MLFGASKNTSFVIGVSMYPSVIDIVNEPAPRSLALMAKVAIAAFKSEADKPDCVVSGASAVTMYSCSLTVIVAAPEVIEISSERVSSSP